MKYQFTEEHIEELEAARKKNKNKQKEKQMQVLLLRARGRTQAETAQITEFARSYVCALTKMYFEQGIGAILENRYHGNHRNMNKEQEGEFVERFREEAEKGRLVTVREIKEAYEREVGHKIGGSQIYRVLRRHDWRKVMPRSKHPNKASEEEIKSSKKLKLA